MSDELKDQRIPIMMTASEVAAIDDWSFSNRIRSRAEAIRRLCQSALLAESSLQLVQGMLVENAGDHLSGFKGILRDLRDDPEASRKAVGAFLELNKRVAQQQTAVMRRLEELQNSLHSIGAAPSFEAAAKEAVVAHLEALLEIEALSERWNSELAPAPLGSSPSDAPTDPAQGKKRTSSGRKK